MAPATVTTAAPSTLTVLSRHVTVCPSVSSSHLQRLLAFAHVLCQLRFATLCRFTIGERLHSPGSHPAYAHVLLVLVIFYGVSCVFLDVDRLSTSKITTSTLLPQAQKAPADKKTDRADTLPC